MQRALILFSLILAGEVVFSLPFHVARFFRPTFLDVFELSNTQLGDIFAVYGIVAMLAYFPGGVIADRFSARRLLTVSLIATATGGLVMARIPNQFGLSLLFGYWGLTSIFLFWASLIKATREWGGPLAQGRAFGLLDGGRGLAAAVVASVAVAVSAYGLPDGLEEVSDTQRTLAMQQVIYFYTLVTYLTALLVWVFVPDGERNAAIPAGEYISRVKGILRRSTSWLQAVVVICAYCGFKGLDNYGLYAVDVLEMTQLESARFMANTAYLRPVAAVLAGLLVDRMFASKIITWSFLLALFSYLSISIINSESRLEWVIYSNVIISFVAVFALRGVYFALLQETRTAHYVTGVTVGVVSFVGFTPDIFFAPLAGRILDTENGIIAYQLYFIFLAIFAIFGTVAALFLMHMQKRINKLSD